MKRQTRVMSMMSIVSAALCVVLQLFAPYAAAAGDFSEPVMLVAKPELRDPVYGSTILIARPLENGGHVGFILNRPTSLTLDKVFPGDDASRKVAEPLYLGGPVGTKRVLALVQQPGKPDASSILMMPNLYAVLDEEAVHSLVARGGDHVRFYAGLVAWEPGELAEEMKKGLWYAEPPDAKVLFRKSMEGLWEELVQRSELRENAI